MTEPRPDTTSAGAAPPRTPRFLTRNAVDALPEGALRASSPRAAPLRVKLGIDPTAPDIHLGHTVVLRKLREFQDLGHTVVLIIGDYTARVGDPSGRSSTRPVLSGEEIDANAETFQRQAFTVLDPERTEVRATASGSTCRWRSSSAWPAPPPWRSCSSATTSPRATRPGSRSRSSSCSTRCCRATTRWPYDADVELGGTDQKFNLLLARDIQQAYGVPPQSILTMPILPGIDGVQRMSKSLGNYVGVTEPPDEMFGKLMRVPDTAMGTYYDLLLDFDLDPSAQPWSPSGAWPGRSPLVFHGDEAAATAEAHFDRLHVQREAPDEIEEFAVTPVNGACTCPRCCATPSASRRPRGGACSPPVASASTGSLSRPRRSTSRPTRSTVRCSRCGRRRFRRVRVS